MAADRALRRYRYTPGAAVFDSINHLFLVGLLVCMLYPFLHVIAVSLSSPDAVISRAVSWFPVGLNILGYKALFASSSIVRAYANTIQYTLAGTFCSLVVGCLGAYPLAMRELRGRAFFNALILLTLFVSGGLIPNFLLIRALGLVNTTWALILPPAFSAWNIILIRTHFRALPESLRDSAFIDGASDWRILAQIYVPLSKPILATIALFAGVAHWNSFFAPLIYLNDPARYPLQLILRRLVLEDDTGYLTQTTELTLADTQGLVVMLRMAAIVVATGPIVFAYPFLQRYFTRGLLVGSLKG